MLLHMHYLQQVFHNRSTLHHCSAIISQIKSNKITTYPNWKITRSFSNCPTFFQNAQVTPNFFSRDRYTSYQQKILLTSKYRTIVLRSFVETSSSPTRKQSLEQIPFQKYEPVLKYIESIGVGIRPRQGQHFKFKKKKKVERHKFNLDNYSGPMHNHGKFSLSPREEASYFANRRRIKQTMMNETQKGKNSKHDNSSKMNSDESNNKFSRKQRSMWMPPPPFSASSDVTFEDHTEQGYQIKRLPIKVLGSSDVVIVNDDENQNMEMGTPTSTTTTTNKNKLEEVMFKEKKFQFPKSSKGLPEVAIAGRSNVGKSTLLNALLYGNQLDHFTGNQFKNRKVRRGLISDSTKLPKGIKAITSNKPGETREITFYQLTSEINLPTNENDDHHDSIKQKQNYKNMCKQNKQTPKLSIILADLPGYGFAYASEERALEWRELMKEYILNRGKSLKRVLLLLDARHGFKFADIEFLTQLQDDLKKERKNNEGKYDNIQNDSKQKNVRRDLPPIQVVLTKCDLVIQKDLARRVIQVREELSDILIRESSSLPVMLVSAKAGLGFNNIRGQKALGGILELQREIAALVPSPKMH